MIILKSQDDPDMQTVGELKEFYSTTGIFEGAPTESKSSTSSKCLTIAPYHAKDNLNGDSFYDLHLLDTMVTYKFAPLDL